MPTLEHSAVVEMFRENPALAPHFLSLLFDLDVPPHSHVAVVEASVEQLIPVELLADLVIELRDAEGKVVLAIVLEMQRQKDPDKAYTIPVYLTYIRNKRRCDTVVLVVALDRAVAEWASGKIDLGLGLSSVKPLVLGPTTVPPVVDPELAEQEVELAILSAIAHGNGPGGLDVVLAALGPLGRLDRIHATAYFQIVYNALREPIRSALEKLIMESQTEAKPTLPPFFQKFIDRAEQEGQLEAKRNDVLRLLARAGIAISEVEVERVKTCTDIPTLEGWMDRVLTARTAADVFG